MENCPDVTRIQQAAIAIDRASTTMGGATHIHMHKSALSLMSTCACINHITGMALLTPLAIPSITKLAILTPIPPRGVRLGAKTCILAITF